MISSLYRTWRARRREVAVQRAAARPLPSPAYNAMAWFGVGLAGIACGGDSAVAYRA